MQLNMMDWIAPRTQSIGELVFFRQILGFLRDRIHDFGIDLLGRVMVWVGGAALTVLTLWILIQGYRIVTGQAKDSMAILMVNAAKAAFIVSAATSMAMLGVPMHTFVTENVKNEITEVVTGDSDSPEEQIDKSLAWMQVAIGSIDALDVVSNPSLAGDKVRAMWFSGIGMGGPALAGGSLLLMYEVALALFIGLGPIFILMLLFDATKQMFWKWLWLGIGTMFSMAVLAAMVSISLDMVVRVAAAFWGKALLGQLMGLDFKDGMTSQAMQQGGLGMILTVLIITTPPMAAMFFQGTLGQFGAYNNMANFAGAGAMSKGMQPGPGGQLVPGGSPHYEAPRGDRPTTTSNPGGDGVRQMSGFNSAPAKGESVELRNSTVATTKAPPPGPRA